MVRQKTLNQEDTPLTIINYQNYFAATQQINLLAN